MLLAALFAVLALAGPQPTPTEAGGKTFGKELAVATEVKIADLVAHPGNYAGKSVRILGIVTAVGENDGSWMDVTDNADGSTIRVHASDEATIYPLEAKGNEVIAEGVFTQGKELAAATKGGTAGANEAASLSLDANGAAQPSKYGYLFRATGATIKM